MIFPANLETFDYLNEPVGLTWMIALDNLLRIMEQYLTDLDGHRTRIIIDTSLSEANELLRNTPLQELEGREDLDNLLMLLLRDCAQRLHNVGPRPGLCKFLEVRGQDLKDQDWKKLKRRTREAVMTAQHRTRRQDRNKGAIQRWEGVRRERNWVNWIEKDRALKQ